MRFFKRIKLTTPESVELEFTLAGIGNRLLAYLIDSLIIWLPYGLVIAPLMRFASRQVEELQKDAAGYWLWMSAILILLTFAWGGGYFVLFETLWRGQTPGKRLTRIRVLRDDGLAIGMIQATLRTLLRLLDDVLAIGYFFVVFGKQEKRLGDWVAGTIVVQDEGEAIGSSQLPLSGQAQNVADQLGREIDVTVLNPDDFMMIKEYLRRRQMLLPEAKTQVSQQLAQQVQECLEIEFQEFSPQADVFLEGLYLAYQEMQS
jgi:uncharacterized RDD family membrane protein YckC